MSEGDACAARFTCMRVMPLSLSGYGMLSHVYGIFAFCLRLMRERRQLLHSPILNRTALSLRWQQCSAPCRAVARAANACMCSCTLCRLGRKRKSVCASSEW